jgi:hypothetical protein
VPRHQVRIPTKAATYSNLIAATYSNLIAATIPIRWRPFAAFDGRARKDAAMLSISRSALMRSASQLITTAL